MTKACDHEIRETRRGAGDCAISYEVHKRNGHPNWWCRTHGMAAWAPDGAALAACPGVWIEPVSKEMQRELDVRQGEIAVWGALPPALTLGRVEDEPGKVHVHRRASPGASKNIDESFDILTLHHQGWTLTIEGMGAVAFSISELAGRTVTTLTCPHCGEVHIDELKFAAYPHRKHLCNSCGRTFRDKTGPSISNPLARAYEELGLPRPPAAVRTVRPLELRSKDFSGIALWPSNSAIVSTMTRPEDIGVHVHAWDKRGAQVIDDTHTPFTLDGQLIEEDQMRVMDI